MSDKSAIQSDGDRRHAPAGTKVRVGRDVKLHQSTRDQLDAPADSSPDPLEHLRAAAAGGLDGILVRTIVEFSPALDRGLLADARALADELGLYLQFGVGKVNPYMTAELPEVRDLGDGDYAAGMERMIAAAAAIGCHELWTATAFQKAPAYGLHAVDRFRTDVTWDEQLRATAAFLGRLAPILRDHGSRLNIETHEEIASGELLRMIEEVGDDVVGVTFDPANCIARGEDPHEVATRLAPYIHQTHLRDVALFDDGGDVVRYLAPCGAGVLDWPRILAIVLTAAPGLALSVEGCGPHRGRLLVPRSDRRWRDDRALACPSSEDPLTGFVARYADRVARGAVPDRTAFERGEAGEMGGIDEFVTSSALVLRAAALRVSSRLHG